MALTGKRGAAMFESRRHGKIAAIILTLTLILAVIGVGVGVGEMLGWGL